MTEQESGPAKNGQSRDGEPTRELTELEYRDWVQERIAGKLFSRLLAIVGVVGIASLLGIYTLLSDSATETMQTAMREQDSRFEALQHQLESTIAQREDAIVDNVAERLQAGTRAQVAETLLNHPSILEAILRTLENPEFQQQIAESDSTVAFLENFIHTTFARDENIFLIIVDAVRNRALDASEEELVRDEALRFYSTLEAQDERVRSAIWEIIQERDTPSRLHFSALELYRPSTAFDEVDRDVFESAVGYLSQADVSDAQISSYKTFFRNFSHGHFIGYMENYLIDPEFSQSGTRIIVADILVGALAEIATDDALLALSRLSTSADEDIRSIGLTAMAGMSTYEEISATARHQAIEMLLEDFGRAAAERLHMTQEALQRMTEFARAYIDGDIGRIDGLQEGADIFSQYVLTGVQENIEEEILLRQAASQSIHRDFYLTDYQVYNSVDLGLRQEINWTEYHSAVVSLLQLAEGERSVVSDWRLFIEPRIARELEADNDITTGTALLLEAAVARMQAEDASPQRLQMFSDRLLDQLVTIPNGLFRWHLRSVTEFALAHASSDQLGTFLGRSMAERLAGRQRTARDRVVAARALSIAMGRDGRGSPPYEQTIGLLEIMTARPGEVHDDFSQAMLQALRTNLESVDDGQRIAVDRLNPDDIDTTIEAMLDAISRKLRNDPAGLDEFELAILEFLLEATGPIYRSSSNAFELVGLWSGLERMAASMDNQDARQRLTDLAQRIAARLQWPAGLDGLARPLALPEGRERIPLSFDGWQSHEDDVWYRVRIRPDDYIVFAIDSGSVDYTVVGRSGSVDHTVVGGSGPRVLALERRSQGEHFSMAGAATEVTRYLRLRSLDPVDQVSLEVRRRPWLRLAASRRDAVPVDEGVLYRSGYESGGQQWVRFAADADATYEIETSNLDGVDTRLTLYDEAGTEIGYDDDGGSEHLASRITLSSTTPGIFLARIDDYSEGQHGEFDLVVRRVD